MTDNLTPTAGQVAVVTLTMGTGAADKTIPGMNWKLGENYNLKDVSNWRDGRRVQDTLTNADLTMTLVFDANDPSYKTTQANIRKGVKGTAKCYVDQTNYYTVPVMVGTVDTANNGMEDVVTQDVGFQLNGGITYPANG